MAANLAVSRTSSYSGRPNDSGSSSESNRSSTPETSDVPTSSEATSEDEEDVVKLTKGIEGLSGAISPDEVISHYPDHLPKIPASEAALKPLAVDAGTPDAWIPRDERMIRLTGKHPYNVEPPLTALWQSGFLTPQHLFYVRSHGATPQVSQQEANEWRVRIHGLVEREVSFTVQELKEKFQTVTVPVTLVCAGNRRKEQNMVAKGLGFNWGAAGVSTALFTGVYLADVLQYCQPKGVVGAFPYTKRRGASSSEQKARHVIFEGTDELPKGRYGTSQRVAWCMDRQKSMLLAWGMNGEDLSPDHGYPLRLVVPGQIGGRMVKWLNRIEVSHQESQHHLHFWDNKLLPTHVTADEARSQEHWWYDPKYIINDLNVNAAITMPAHDEKVSEIAKQEWMRVAGYAYTGGGKRVNRVEITLDEGKSWKLCHMHWPEDLYRLQPIEDHPVFGTLDLTQTEMSFAWCFWQIQIPTSEFCKVGGSVAVRATDEGLAQMPRDMYWNATSMMNNCWFRVACNAESDKVEHPTQAGNAQGGWMERFNEEGKSSRYPTFDDEAEAKANGSAAAAPKRKVEKVDVDALMRDEAKMQHEVSGAELQEHANEHSPWFVVNGHVFDGTAFLEKHPGGAESITLVAGEDATEDFMAIHSIDAKKQMREFHIGKLSSDAAGALASDAAVDEKEDPDAPFLHPKKWKTSKLVERTQISHDSFIFRFAMDRPDQVVGLPIGQHVYVRVHDKENGNELVQRAYTPFSGNELVGFLDILIKVYRPCQEYPGGGRMTNVLEKMVVGTDAVELKGPTGHFIYEQGGVFRIDKHVRKNVKNVAMIAGGSGITPIWSTLKGLVEDPNAGHIRIWIIDANRTEADILARQHIDDLLLTSSERVKLWHLVSGKLSPEDDAKWTMGRGRITLDCLRTHLPPPATAAIDDEDGHPADDTIALLCGPAPMEQTVLQGLEALGWNMERNVVRF